MHVAIFFLILEMLENVSFGVFCFVFDLFVGVFCGLPPKLRYEEMCHKCVP